MDDASAERARMQANFLNGIGAGLVVLGIAGIVFAIFTGKGSNLSGPAAAYSLAAFVLGYAFHELSLGRLGLINPAPSPRDVP